MREILELLERQARWQKSRKDLPWAEKIRMAERVREDAARWSLSGRKVTAPPEKPTGDQQ
jgi:hypothetical protein